MIEQIVEFNDSHAMTLQMPREPGFHFQSERGSRGIQRAAAKDIEISRSANQTCTYRSVS
jgi:hypothetical protein